MKNVRPTAGIIYVLLHFGRISAYHLFEAQSRVDSITLANTFESSMIFLSHSIL